MSRKMERALGIAEQATQCSSDHQGRSLRPREHLVVSRQSASRQSAVRPRQNSQFGSRRNREPAHAFRCALKSCALLPKVLSPLLFIERENHECQFRRVIGRPTGCDAAVFPKHGNGDVLDLIQIFQSALENFRGFCPVKACDLAHNPPLSFQFSARRNCREGHR